MKLLIIIYIIYDSNPLLIMMIPIIYVVIPIIYVPLWDWDGEGNCMEMSTRNGKPPLPPCGWRRSATPTSEGGSEPGLATVARLFPVRCPLALPSFATGAAI